ncbi:general transcription factor 3C polypeptide 1 [Anabrus simplex]|uniref:general transcription factor 3C polypeptide 1 n=1 Tax=Anabrus simplex TaxID=316456 RepID=UPI0035A27C3C
MAEYEDHVTAILDEIALEGLDGITLEGLWVRLTDRPYFQDVIDDVIKEYVWNTVKYLEDISMYLLPEPRAPLKVFDRYDFVDPELGMILEPDVLPVDIYPYNPIEDTVNDVRGSCKDYYTRIPITNEIQSVSLAEVLERFGSRLVLVASQSARDIALLGYETDPELELTKIQYCILERIGRSRYLGEVTQGKVSLQMVVEDPKALFYHRKFLMNHGLIVKQIHHQKSGSQNCSGSLLHLPRFYVERRPKVLYLTERVVELLKTRENYLAEYEEIRRELALTSSLRKFFQSQYFQRFVRTDLRLPYRVLYPDAKVSEWKLKGRDKEKLIHVLQLIDPNTDVVAVSSRDDDLDLLDDDDISESYGSMEDFKMAMNVSYLSQVHEYVEKSGSEGLSQVEISERLGLPKLNARTVSRNLMKRGMASIFMNDVGRQRVTRFRSKVFGKRPEVVAHLKENEEINETYILAKSAASQDVESNDRKETPLLKRKRGNTKQNETCKKLKLDVDEDDPTSFSVYEELPEKNEEENEDNSEQESSLVFTPRSGSPESVEMSQSIGDSQELCSSSQNECEPVKIGDSYDLSRTGYIIINNKLQNKFLRTRYGHQLKEAPNMTLRIYKRINIILDYVKVHKVIDDYSKLIKVINAEEEKEGSTMKIDRKSLFRLIFRLNEEGYLNVFSYLLTDGVKEKMFFFICEPSITTGHSAIQSGIEQAKMKMFIVNKESINTIVKTQQENDSESLEESAEELKAITGKVKKMSLVYDKKIGRKYGLSPKFVRMRILHQILFYLIYDYQGNDNMDQKEVVDYFISKEIEIDDALASDLPKVYFKDVNWRMFIPPLRRHTGWPDGWAIMSDILLRLPVSLFVKIFNVTYVVPNFDYWLNHPIRKHFLLRHLPVNVRNCLMATRKYIFSIYEVLQQLCYVGLIQFGPQRFKEKDQVLFYLNRRTTLLDTVSSKPGYHQISDEIYDEHTYEFSVAGDVDKYWYDLWNTCLHTRLGGRMCVQGKDIVLEALSTKPAMIHAVTPRQADEAPRLDTGFVPGDRKGAAGLDSALFSHLKRNWNWTNAHTPAKPQSQDLLMKGMDKRRARLASVKCDPVIFSKYTVMVKKSINFLHSGKFFKTSKHDKKALTSKTANKKVSKKPVSSRRNVVRRVQARKCATRHRPYYDEIDMHALKLMSKLRVEWSTEEDNLLLLCKVASMYLCPNPRQQIIGFHVVRDILHEAIPTSSNKTSRACQRRILYVMKNNATASNIAMHLEEVKQDSAINRKYGDALATLKVTCESSAKLEDALNEKFKMLVKDLQLRSNTMVSGSPSSKWKIPDSPAVFWDMYDVTEPKNTLKFKGHFQDVENVSDVYCALLNATIISSLCCPSDKTSWAYQLFKVYQQYPDSMLRSTMAKIRADQMVSLKKSYVPLVQKNNYLPLSSSPYQLSATYIHLLQTKYQYRIYHESFTMAEKLLEMNGCLSPEELGIKTVITNGGSTAALVQLLHKNQICFSVEIPEQVIILDPRISEIDQSYARIVERYRDILQNYKPGYELTSSALLRKLSYGHETEENIDVNKDSRPSNVTYEDDDDDMEGALEPVCAIEDVTFDESESPAATSQQMVLARTASRIALFMMREELEDTNVGASQHAHDFFVVNSCQVYCKLMEPIAEDSQHRYIMPLTQEKINEVLDCMKKQIVVDTSKASEELVHQKLIDLEASDEEHQLVKDILMYTLDKKEIGATIKELRTTYLHRCIRISLAQILSILVETNMFLRSGVTTMHYIHKNYMHHWLVHTYKLLRSSREKLQPTHVRAISLGSRDEGESVSRKEISKDPTSKHAAETHNLGLVEADTGGSNLNDNQLDSMEIGASSDQERNDESCSNSEVMEVNTQAERNETSEIPSKNFTAQDKAVSIKLPGTDISDTHDKSATKLGKVVELSDISCQSNNLTTCSDYSESLKTVVEETQDSDNFVMENADQTSNDDEAEKVSFSSSNPSPSEREKHLCRECRIDNIIETEIVKAKGDDVLSSEESGEHEQAKESDDETNLKAEGTDDESKLKKPLSKKRTFSNCSSCGKRTLIYQSGKKAVIQSGNMEKFIERIHFSDAEKIQVAIRPWVRINGSLNRRVVDRMLGAVLGHCMFKPGQSIKEIGQRFTPALQPFQIQELIEVLQKLGCVNLCAVQKSHKTTLFSKPSHVRLVPADGTEDESLIVVEPQPDAVLRLGQFIGHKAYAQDFLSC